MLSILEAFTLRWHPNDNLENALDDFAHKHTLQTARIVGFCLKSLVSHFLTFGFPLDIIMEERETRKQSGSSCFWRRLSNDGGDRVLVGSAVFKTVERWREPALVGSIPIRFRNHIGC
jgi:hypothetical protein